MNQSDALAQGQIFAGCKIERKIGQGGMGSVYKAHFLSLDKSVCVKILAKNLAADQRNVEFFLREARSAAKLEHPNIVQVYNFGQENGLYYIIMSYINGTPLDIIVKQKGALSVEEARDIIIPVLKALKHAHEKTIIHRDIKPSNILIDEKGEPRIVDFGLARSINEEKQLTIAGEMVGTAYFMSPEQGLAAKVDHRADLYSVGATFFYLLTGKYPYEGETSIEVIHKHISAPLPNIFLLLPEAPIWVPKVLQKLMAKKPEERYQTAEEVIKELEKYKDPEQAKSLYNAERTLEIPEVETKIKGQEDKTPLEAAEPKPPGTKPEEKPEKPLPPPPKIVKSKTQIVFLPKLIKTLVHFSLTFSSLAVLLLAGCLPSKQGSVLGPALENPVASLILILVALFLLGWSAYLKPRKFTPLHSVFMSIMAICAYVAGTLTLAPSNFDMISKTMLILSSAAKNIFLPNNLLPYSVFFLVIASIFAYKSSFLTKTIASTSALLSIFLIYKFFQVEHAIKPDYAVIFVIALVFFTGTILSFSRKEFSLLLNPFVFFLLADFLIFFSLSSIQVKALTQKKQQEDLIRVEKEKKEALIKEQQLMLQEIPQYDEEGKPIIKKRESLADAIKPKPPSLLRKEATKEYYGKLFLTFRQVAMKTGGFIVISFLCLFLINLLFAEEIFTFKREVVL